MSKGRSPYRPNSPLVNDGKGRWTSSDKSELLSQIRQGKITLLEVCERFDLSAEEIAIWQSRYRTGGRAALRATRPLEAL
jgi:transposase-like protein